MIPVSTLYDEYIDLPKLTEQNKKHSRTSPEIQFKELNEQLRGTLPDQQIN